jgi:hypothetical protein
MSPNISLFLLNFEQNFAQAKIFCLEKTKIEAVKPLHSKAFEFAEFVKVIS